jgi:hypothetical protein
MSQINWAKLVATGRAKEMGVPWNEAEDKAIYELKIPVDYVRDGVLTLEDYASELEKEAKDGKRLSRMELDELLSKAESLGVKTHPDMNKKVLADLISKALAIKASQAEQARGVAKAHEEEDKFRIKEEAKAKKALEKEAAKNPKQKL